MILNSQEKTIRYAQLQIKEGDFMSGKSILDTTLRQLQFESFGDCSEEIESKRSTLIGDIRDTLEEIKRVRL
jgi:hypothetical protein